MFEEYDRQKAIEFKIDARHTLSPTHLAIIVYEKTGEQPKEVVKQAMQRAKEFRRKHG